MLWVEKTLPFLALLLVVFLYRHFAGKIVQMDLYLTEVTYDHVVAGVLKLTVSATRY